MNSILHGQNSSIRKISDSRSEQKAAYRFLNNEMVTEQELIESCYERSSCICEGRHVLVLNDTTEINLNSHAGRIKAESGVGLVGNNKDIGFFAHLGLVVDIEQYQAIGFSSMQFWHRSTDKRTKDERKYAQLPVEEKESYKWLNCVNNSVDTLTNAASITVVGDRESDMYELFTDAKTRGVHVLARSRINRRTLDGISIEQALENTPQSGTFEIEIIGDKRKATSTRVAKMAVKFCEVNIKKPAKKKDTRPEQTNVWLVEAMELSGEKGIHWKLLTTHEITSYEDALELIEWYKMRWFIEQVFRLLKNKGFQIEDSQLEQGWALRKLTVLMLQNILRIMQMLIAYNSPEEQDASIAFSQSELECLDKLNKRYEGKTEKLKNSYNKNSMKWVTWIIARLGGWSGYTSQRPPGPITLKNGLDRFNHVYTGWMIAKDVGTQ
ncbi:MAG: IS4 family transposase [Flavobacterium sp. BFFFF2]|nr:MAG: IS4 family transposase [Flavobacterium sp. BFFFF2]